MAGSILGVFDLTRLARIFALFLALAILAGGGVCGLASAQTAAADSQYRLAVGDVLLFKNLADDELPQQITVGEDGTIQAPLLGTAKVAGLTIDSARDELARLFKERQLLVDPRIALSVVSYRPVFVLGDVKSPGSFPFQPGLTVEKAIGLAGGLSTLLGNPQDQIMSRSKLQGDLEQSSSDITTESVAVARLIAQLDKRATISENDFPERARPAINRTLANTLTETSERLLKTAGDTLDTQIKLLQQNLEESERALETLNQLADNQKSAIQYSQDDYNRADALLKKGMKTATEVSALQRQLTLDEGRLLAIYAQISAARNGIGSLKRELATSQATWRQSALLSLQDEQAKIDKLLSARRTIEQQLFLVTNWTSEEALRSRVAIVDYKIRRKSLDKGMEEIVANPLVTLRPDDVVLVTVQPTTPPGVTSQGTPSAALSGSAAPATAQKTPNAPSAANLAASAPTLSSN
jgi:polysaccharide biosynthesis/export protein ExoF